MPSYKCLFLPWGKTSRAEYLNYPILLCVAPEYSTGSNPNSYLQHGQHNMVVSFLFLFI